MKKVFRICALITALMMMACMFVGCSESGTLPAVPEEKTEAADPVGTVEETTEETPVLEGGWAMQASAAADLPADVADVFARAKDQWNGIDMQCVALLGTQVVAGLNYAFLTESTVNGNTTYSIAIVYEDFQGNVTLTSVNDIAVPESFDGSESPEQLAGGWTVSEENYAAAADTAALDKALEGLVGAQHTPIAMIATQVVAGTNYLYIAKWAPVVQDPVTGLEFISVYEDLSGNCSINGFADLKIADYNTGAVEAEDAATEAGEDVAEAGMMTGSWEIQESPAAALDADLTKVFAPAKDAGLTPVALLGTQVVAGTNYAFLAQDAEAVYYCVVIYQDLEGKVEILDMHPVVFTAEAKAADEDVLGGWTVAENSCAQLSEDAKAAFDKAMEGLVGVGYTPLAMVATQVVAGTNYLYLCTATTVTAEPVTSLKLVTVYQDLEGNCTIGDIADFNIVSVME